MPKSTNKTGKRRTTKPRKSPPTKVGLWLRMKRAFFRVTLLAVLVGLLWFIWPLVHLLSMDQLASQPPERSALMTQREEQAHHAGQDYKIRYFFRPLPEISPWLVQAVLVAEDARFYRHQGFDWQELGHAVQDSLTEDKRLRGASTLTQQLAKNLFLSPQRSLRRKLLEALFTWRLEESLSKERILCLYLNVIEWGRGIFGAEAAARHYFGKKAKALSLDEAIRLASITINPLRFRPQHTGRTMTRRRRFIADQLLLSGIITEAQRRSLPY